MISLRKPLGSLESPAVSGPGLSPLVDIMCGGWSCSLSVNSRNHREDGENTDRIESRDIVVLRLCQRPDVIVMGRPSD